MTGQGRPESSYLWNSAMAITLSPLVASWFDCGMGMFWSDTWVSHACFADSLWLLARSWHMLTVIIKKLTVELANHGLKWKEGKHKL